jgi:HTH-type transcriptional regulator / antitoxin HipB
MKEISEMADLGRIVRYHRKRARLSRAAFSELAGIGTTVIYELEHGKPTVQFDVVQSVLRTLNLTLLVDGPLVDEYVDRSNEASTSSSER